MPIPLEAPEVLSREYLEVRAKLLQVAATLDRIERASGSVTGDPRLAKIRDALHVLLAPAPQRLSGVLRAEQIQLVFSLPYDDEWQDKFFSGG